MRLTPLLLLLAVPALSQIRSAPQYDGTAPGHPADEPGPDLGSNAEDAFALLARGDRDAARVSASRCVRSESRDHACRLLVEAVEAGLEAPKLPPSGVGRARADLHFMAGADYYYNGEPADARREWETCRRLDAGHGFCALGLKLLPRPADEPAPERRAPLKRRTRR